MRQTTARKAKTEKIVMLGAASSGKTSIVTRFAHNRFSTTSESTIGAAFVSKNIEVKDREVKLEIWDTGGSERYRALAPMYYRDTNAAIIVFDLTSPPSLDDAQIWLNELRERGPPKVLIAVAANKSDLKGQRQIQPDRIKEFAQNNNVDFIRETSAVDGSNINELFMEISEKLLTIVDADTVDEDDQNVILDAPPPETKSKGCC